MLAGAAPRACALADLVFGEAAHSFRGAMGDESGDLDKGDRGGDEKTSTGFCTLSPAWSPWNQTQGGYGSI
jgi:hypothetical protein